MVHILKFTAFAGERILDVTADPDTQADGLDRLAELARNASPKTRAPGAHDRGGSSRPSNQIHDAQGGRAKVLAHGGAQHGRGKAFAGGITYSG